MRGASCAAAAVVGALLALVPAAAAGGARDRDGRAGAGPILPAKIHWHGNGHGHGHGGPPPVPQPPATGVTQPLGTVQQWPQVDVSKAPDDPESLTFVDYTLRGVGAHVEVWVANDLSFQPGDCRTARTTITQQQVQYVIGQLESTVYPREAAVYGVPPQRDGSHGFDPAAFGGRGDRIVILVDNIRDPSWHDLDDTLGLPYLGGFFAPAIAEGTDRNVITIDAFDWLHRLGASPPNAPVPGNNCLSAPARPFFYEALLAHEYSNLLEYYADPTEEQWTIELLAEYAETLTGYTNPALPITNVAFDGTTQCFLGWLSVQTAANPTPRPGGPENSLTLWGDRGPEQILCDYGAVHTFAQFLADRYGSAFLGALQRDPQHGLAGLADVMRRFGVGGSTQDLIHDWAATVAVDAALDDGAKVQGPKHRESDFQTRSLHASVDWDNPDAFQSPGAPPNGSDYVRLRDGTRYLSASDLGSLVFDGATSLPIEWSVDSGALASGAGDNLDRALLRRVSVPVTNPTLTFVTRYSTETAFDYGFVQVSTDGGATWSSLANADTNVPPAPGASAAVVANQPGFTGESGGWRSESFDLSPYAGRTVLLAFRYVTDAATTGPGWWIDDVAVGGIVLSDGSTLNGWLSPTQARPASFGGFTVQLVAYSSSGRDRHAYVATLALDAQQHVALDAKALRKLVDSKADVVAAIVTFDDPAESTGQYATYRLAVNGVTQPGGS